MRRCLLICLRAALVGVLAPALALAQAPPEQERYRLSWVRGKGAEECPSAGQLAEAVRQRLGRDPFSNDAPRDIEGNVARVDDVWQARLNVLGPDGAVLGSRDLSTQAPTCALLADAVTLAIALTIDPTAPLTMPEQSSPPPKSAEPPAPPPPAPEPPPPTVAAPAPAPSAAPTPASPFGLGASAKGSILFGLLPRPAPGGELGVDLKVTGRVRFTAGLIFLGEVRTAGDEFAVGLTAATLGGCFDLVGKPNLGLDACADVQAGVEHVVVYAPDPVSPGERAWFSGRLGPRVRWKFAAPVELVIAGAGMVPFIVRDLGVEGEDKPLFEMPSLGFFAGAGLGASIP